MAKPGFGDQFNFVVDLARLDCQTLWQVKLVQASRDDRQSKQFCDFELFSFVSSLQRRHENVPNRLGDCRSLDSVWFGLLLLLFLLFIVFVEFVLFFGGG